MKLIEKKVKCIPVFSLLSFDAFLFLFLLQLLLLL